MSDWAVASKVPMEVVDIEFQTFGTDLVFWSLRVLGVGVWGGPLQDCLMVAWQEMTEAIQDLDL